jgi:hypothetical protein
MACFPLLFRDLHQHACLMCSGSISLACCLQRLQSSTCSSQTPPAALTNTSASVRPATDCLLPASCKSACVPHAQWQQITCVLLASVAAISMGNAAGGAPRQPAALAQLLRAQELTPHLQKSESSAFQRLLVVLACQILLLW